MNEIMLALIPYLGPGFVGIIIGYLIKYYLDYRYSKIAEENNRKRAVYEDIVKSLQIFISGRDAEEEKKLFTTSYEKAWLWASDEVILILSQFIKSQVEISKCAIKDDTKSKTLYVACLIAMRKDLGMKKTVLGDKDHQFFRF